MHIIQTKTTNKIDMTTGSIFPKLLKFSIPLVLSSILQLFFNAADIVVVGRFAGDNSLAAVGTTSSLINLLVNIFVGLSIGSNVVAANYFGAGNKKYLKKTVHTSIVLSVYSGIILTLVGIIFAKRILLLMQAPSEVLDLAVKYLRIYFAGITVTMIYNFGSALLRAKGDTQRPFYILLLSGIVNVLLNLLFVIKFNMNVEGVALATVISQSLAAFLIIYLLFTENDDFKLELKELKIDREVFRKIVKIGVPAGFQGIMFSLSNVIIQSSINTFGSVVIAGNSSAVNIEGFVYTSMNGIAQGTLTFVSQNMGSKNIKRIKKVVLESIITVLVLGEALGFLVILYSNKLLGIYSNSIDVIQIGERRLLIICSTYALCGIMDTIANSLRGIGHSLLPVIITMLSVCAFRIMWLISIFQIERFHTIEIIYLSYPISWLAAFLIMLFCFIQLIKKENFGEK